MNNSSQAIKVTVAMTFPRRLCTTVFQVILLFCSLMTSALAAERLQGTVSIDGSSTVFPISEAVAEEFGAVQPRVRVTVGVSGTGGGFKKFLADEIDINDASRPISASEFAIASASGQAFLELPIAFDGISIVVNNRNTWVDSLTVAELRQIWQPGSNVRNWSDIRPDWPTRPIRLYGPGTDSGTFDYFTETINGETGASRPDYTSNEDDNALVRGVSGDEYAMGYFGFAYYAANSDVLKLVAIDGGNGAVAPSAETINNGTYAPLSRPVFIYVRVAALQRPEVKALVDFYIDNVALLASEVGYIALPDLTYQRVKTRIESRASGTAYVKGNTLAVDTLLEP